MKECYGYLVSIYLNTEEDERYIFAQVLTGLDNEFTGLIIKRKALDLLNDLTARFERKDLTHALKLLIKTFDIKEEPYQFSVSGITTDNFYVIYARQNTKTKYK